MWLCGGALGASALFLFVGLGNYPIILWDESRLAVNALEMFLTGPAIVTTYNFAPDLWNTKPPLLIWLMTGSMTLLGPSEVAVRLPSAAAAMATLLLTTAFAWRLTRSAFAAFLACVLLVTSQGFHGAHGAATGDYDALLTLFTTGYLCLLFFAVHRRRPPMRRMIAAGTLIAAAILTKGIAGLIPGIGLVLYLVYLRRWTRPFATAGYLTAAAIVLFATGAFYGLREIAGPGYLADVARNELSGRYFETIGSHREPFFFFGRVVVGSGFSAGPLLCVLPFGVMVAKGRARLGIVFASCAAAGTGLVYSFSATKLAWYVAPAYPFLAIALALSVSLLARRIVDGGTTRGSGRWAVNAEAVVIAALSLAIVATTVYRFKPMSTETADPQAHYGEIFAALDERGIHSVTVVDGGEPNEERLSDDYAPRLRFYQLLWQTRAFRVREIVDDVARLSTAHGEAVVTCDARYVEDLRRQAPVTTEMGGCVAVEP